MFDGKHSDQTVLNKLPEQITERGEEKRMREEQRGRKKMERGVRERGGYNLKKSMGMCVFDLD